MFNELLRRSRRVTSTSLSLIERRPQGLPLHRFKEEPSFRATKSHSVSGGETSLVYTSGASSTKLPIFTTAVTQSIGESETYTSKIDATELNVKHWWARFK